MDVHQANGVSILFEPVSLGGRELKNRLASLPVFTGYALPDGTVSSLLLEHYTRLAASGPALVVVANAAVAADGVTSIYNLRVDDDRFIPGLKRLARAIKRQGALACLQLNHAGMFARTERPLLPAPMDGSHLVFNVASLNEFMNSFPLEKRFGLTRKLLQRLWAWSRPMSPDDKERIRLGFGHAAARAVEAGFDMVELHGATGYLITQFLSGYTNRVKSGADGFEERAEYPLEIFRTVISSVPDRFPAGFRLLTREWVPEGIDLDEAVALAKLLKKEGVAYLSVSAGTYSSMFSAPVHKQMVRPGYLLEDSAAVRKETGVPTIASGRLLTPDIAARALKRGAADIIGLGRPLIADPEWISKARSGVRPRVCSNCQACIKRVVLEQGLSCSRWPKWVQERASLEHRLLTRGMVRSLVVLSGEDDMAIMKAMLPSLVPPRQGLNTAFLFLESRDNHGEPGRLTSEQRFRHWAESFYLVREFKRGDLSWIAKRAEKPRDEELLHAVSAGSYGTILIGLNTDQPWRERFLYRQRGKTIGMIGRHPRQDRVLAAIDMSETALLVLRHLCQVMAGNPAVTLDIIHVLESPARPVLQRWDEFRKILGWDEDFRLRLVEAEKDPAAKILKELHDGDYGRIIMGKRGLSGIKRWLLGSVSSHVFRGLEDRSLFLID